MGKNLDEARAILKSYWGTMGADRTLRIADLRKLKLKPTDIDTLIDELPPAGPSTTGLRADHCARTLERLRG